MITCKWKDSEWKDAGAELRRWKNMDVPQFVRHRARVLVQDLIKWTPPRGKNPGSETWPEQKKRGEMRIERDCRRLFVPLSEMNIVKNPIDKPGKKVNGVRIVSISERIKRLMRMHDYPALEKLFFTLGIKFSGIIGTASKMIHAKAVAEGTRGRPARHKRYAVVEKGSITDLIRALKQDVGKLKAGWGAAAVRFGVPPRGRPAWVSRHGAGGSFEDRTGNTTRPTVRVINDNKAAKDMSQAEIVDAAIAINERKMVIEAQKISKYMQRKFNRR